jgi:NADP-dependent 3-hydroxy acid dehydrogenase YdfG
MHKIAGRAAILTGASGGIGPYIARQLASEQVRLVLAAVNVEEIETLRSELVNGGAEAVAVRTDVRDVAGLKALIARSIEIFKNIDFLVNNAGINNVLPYSTIETREIDDILSTNQTGHMLLAR